MKTDPSLILALNKADLLRPEHVQANVDAYTGLARPGGVDAGFCHAGR